MTTVENWNRQQVKYGQIDVDNGGEPQEILETKFCLASGLLRNQDRASQLFRRDIARD